MTKAWIQMTSLGLQKLGKLTGNQLHPVIPNNRRGATTIEAGQQTMISKSPVTTARFRLANAPTR